MVRVVKGLPQVGEGQTMPSGVIWSRDEGVRPSKMKEWAQERQRRERRVEDLKRMVSGIWDSSGEISAAALPLAEEEAAMEYFLTSRPKHSASCVASVPGMGAQRRSMGGKSCL